MIIIGIDPGVRFAGFAVMKKQGQVIQLLDCGYLAMKPTCPLPDRIAQLHDFFNKKIVQFSVDTLVLETPFLGKSPQNFLKLGYVRGILYLLTSKYSLALYEFAPTQIKQAITGFGGASKDQLARVIHQLFPKMKATDRFDITDAVAITLCGAWSAKTISL